MVGVVVAELATNLLRYAHDGEIEVAPIGGSRGVGIAVSSRDSGPGIADVGAALRDDVSTAGGLGQVALWSSVECGSRHAPSDCGGQSRISRRGGQRRRLASGLAKRPALSPLEGLRLCHDALGSTRGAAISIASIDLDTSRLVDAGVGNVDALLWQAGHQERLVGYRGTVGRILPTLRDFSFSLVQNWVLLVHTDGVSSRFQVGTLLTEVVANPQQLAQHMLADWGRTTDDATVVVIRANL